MVPDHVTLTEGEKLGRFKPGTRASLHVLGNNVALVLLKNLKRYFAQVVMLSGSEGVGSGLNRLHFPSFLGASRRERREVVIVGNESQPTLKMRENGGLPLAAICLPGVGVLRGVTVNSPKTFTGSVAA